MVTQPMRVVVVCINVIYCVSVCMYAFFVYFDLDSVNKVLSMHIHLYININKRQEVSFIQIKHNETFIIAYILQELFHIITSKNLVHSVFCFVSFLVLIYNPSSQMQQII